MKGEIFYKMRKSYTEYENNRSRKNRVTICLDDLELEMLNDKFEASDYPSRSEFLRDLIVFGNVIKVDNSVYSSFDNVTYQLERIGNNINQIAHKVNSQNKIYQSDIEEVKEKMKEVWLLQRSIQSSLP